MFNTVASEREEVVEVSWASDIGTRRARVLDSAGQEIPCQFLRPRKFTTRGAATASGRPAAGATSVAGIPAYAPGESLNAAAVMFRARVPAIGYGSYRIEPVNDDTPPAAFPGATAKTDTDGTVILETDLYRVRIDPARGGTISSLVAKDGNREFVDAASERRFNEYRGYFVSEQKWASSADNRATVTIAERGPVRVRALVSGQILGRRFQTTITLAEGQRRIDLSARFTYDQDTWIGDPWDIKPEDRRTRAAPLPSRWPLETAGALSGAIPQSGHLQERRLRRLPQPQSRTPISRSGMRSSTISSSTGWISLTSNRSLAWRCLPTTPPHTPTAPITLPPW